MGEPGPVTAIVEEYLEAIYNMRTEGLPPMAARLAERMRVSIPTVMATLRRMERDGLVRLDPRREVGLTERGETVATTLLRRHRLVEKLLTDVLHVPWHEVHAEACRLEHAISPRLETYLDDALGHPDRCPHGNPIPGNGAVVAANTVPLSELERGRRAVIEHVSEMAERQPEFLDYLGQHRLSPGREVVVEETMAFGGTLIVRGESGPVVLGLPAAQHVWARPLTDAEPQEKRQAKPR